VLQLCALMLSNWDAGHMSVVSSMLQEKPVHLVPPILPGKVWLFAQSEAGTRATATWYSLFETARANGLEPYWYLRKVFEEMPIYLRDQKPVDDLLPWNVDSKELAQLARRD